MSNKVLFQIVLHHKTKAGRPLYYTQLLSRKDGHVLASTEECPQTMEHVIESAIYILQSVLTDVYGMEQND